MCGIFGVFCKKDILSSSAFKKSVRMLFKLSESRGKESSGLAWWQDEKVIIYKATVRARDMLRSPEYKAIESEIGWEDTSSGSVALIGHCRLVTNGLQSMHYNNQPLSKGGSVAVHNGIITNDCEIWSKIAHFQREFEVDTEVFLALLEDKLQDSFSIEQAWRWAYSAVEGSVSIGVFHTDFGKIVTATDNGSLYTCGSNELGFHAFASEKHILKKLLAQPELVSFSSKITVQKVHPKKAVLFDFKTLNSSVFSLDEDDSYCPSVSKSKHNIDKVKVYDLSKLESPESCDLVRCTKCILPETMPFIEFDEQGVCNFCRNHQPRAAIGESALDEILESYRKNDGSPDCLVGFSGGRDSSYGLHLLKNKYGMNPVAFTYDWGMVTDLARRNIYRICGKLGIEHIIVSADIRKKRENVRRNIMAWLKQPDLGMIPLFMAGDKQFYYHANKIMDRMNIGLVVFCENGKFERAHFKSGYCGINEGSRRAFNITLAEKIKIALYYISRFIRNPRYINRSIIDTLTAFYSTYVLKHDYLFLFEYVDWNEEEVVDTLIKTYNWETSPDTVGTWRIGDGTAPFYNYIYYTMTGFTEHDTFRSNQIRHGVISRDEAIAKVQQENQIRIESMEWYANKIGFDLNEALCKVNAAPKLYKTYNLHELIKGS